MTGWTGVAQPRYVPADTLANFLNLLRERGFDSAPTARIENGKLEVAWLPGQAADQATGSFSHGFWEDCGTRLRALHDLSNEEFAGFEPLRIAVAELERYDSSLLVRAGLLRFEHERMSIADLSFGNHSAVLHGDLSLGNLIGEAPASFVGFIDWEYARRGPAVIDVANLLWQMLSHQLLSGDLDGLAIRRMLQGYGYKESISGAAQLLVVIDFLVDRRIAFLKNELSASDQTDFGYTTTLMTAIRFRDSLHLDTQRYIRIIAG